MIAAISNGTITALKEGNAIISVSAGNKSANCKVIVTPIDVKEISFASSETTIRKGQNCQLTVVFQPINATLTKKITWETSNSDVAIVQDGTVYGKGVGTCTISAKYGDLVASCNIIVDNDKETLRKNAEEEYNKKVKDTNESTDKIISECNLTIFKLEKEGLQYLSERQVDGIILFPIGLSKEYIQALYDLKIPIVTIYNKLDNRFPFVGVNDRKAMTDAVMHIASKGYKRITYLTPDMGAQEKQGLNTYTLRQRTEGYLDGMKGADLLDEVSILAKGSLEEKLEKFIKQNDFSSKTALLCLCDSYAIDAMTYLQNKGMHVPEQVGIMGYDDVDQLKYIHPRITTIKYSVLRMGKIAIDMLFQNMEQKIDNQECLLEYEIVDGESL